ncbi:MAG: helix-turn-helix domain-containing protein [Terrimicrobiaceae bacterium]
MEGEGYDPHRKRPLRTRATTESAKLARRASLVLTARSLFASRDFDDVSVDEIAKKAQFAKGTVYLYFGTKGSVVPASGFGGNGCLGQEAAVLFESALKLAPGTGARLTPWMHALIRLPGTGDAHDSHADKRAGPRRRDRGVPAEFSRRARIGTGNAVRGSTGQARQAVAEIGECRSVPAMHFSSSLEAGHAPAQLPI